MRLKMAESSQQSKAHLRRLWVGLNYKLRRTVKPLPGLCERREGEEHSKEKIELAD